MDLAVDFECPGCGKRVQLKLIDLSPGKERRCTDCNAHPVLTEWSLHELQRRLMELYPSTAAPFW